MKYFLFLCLSIGIIHKGFSQAGDTTQYHLKYRVTGILNKTNDTRSQVLTNALGLSLVRKKIELNSNNVWVYGRQNKQLTNNDFTSTLNLDFLKELQRLYYWGLANFASSYSLKINSQLQAGAGIGYNVLNKPGISLVISDGILYETSEMQPQPATTEKYNTFRNSFRIKHKLALSQRLSLDGAHFWQPSLSRFDDYLIQSSSTLSYQLRKWLSLTAAVTYNKVSRTQRENLLISFGLAAETVF